MKINGITTSPMNTDDNIRKYMKINEKILGPDHTDVAMNLTNLAKIYFVKENFAKAKSLTKRALEINEINQILCHHMGYLNQLIV